MSFFKHLRNSLEIEPTRGFDQRMQLLIDQEMGTPPRPTPHRFLDLRLALSTALAASLVLAYFWSKPGPFSWDGAVLSENIEFLMTIETLGDFDEEELIGASDEEWAVALGDSES